MMKRYEKYKNSGIEWIGEIPFHWKTSKVKWSLNFHNNLRKPLEAKERGNRQGKYPYYGASGIIDYINDYIFDGKYILLGEDGANILTRSSPLAFIAEGKFWVNNHAHILDVKEGELLYFKEQLELNNFENIASGSAQPKLTKEAIANLDVIVPPLDEQTQISQYLNHQTSLIDQLISKKEKLVQLLQEQRQAIINEAVTKGLDSNVEMKDSGIEWLGEIPEHWKVGKLGHYSTIVRGGSPRPAGDPKYFGGDFMPWITVAEVTKGNDKFLYKTKSFLTEDGSKKSRIVYPETLLLSNSGATLGVPKITKIKGCINDGSVAFISYSEKLERDYLYCFFTTHTQIYRDEMKGSGQPNLNTDIIKSTTIPIPPINEQVKIINEIENKKSYFDKLIYLQFEQVQKLKEYRQSIISEAVTGKVDVRDWQAPTTKKEI